MLVVESDDGLKNHIATVLSDAGYEVSTDYPEGMKAVLGFDPGVVILGADPPKLDCCDLLSEIKGSDLTRNIRVVMLSPGGPVERTRGLDLGADDVLSLPFDPQELLSRMRSQLRNKRIADQLRTAEAGRNATQQVVTVVNEERKMLRFGALANRCPACDRGTDFFVLSPPHSAGKCQSLCRYQQVAKWHANTTKVARTFSSRA